MGAEIRTAVRAVARRPASSLILIMTIGLGIGATTAIFTVVDTVLLRPLPFRQPARLANIWTLEKDGFSHPGVQPEVADYWRQRSGCSLTSSRLPIDRCCIAVPMSRSTCGPRSFHTDCSLFWEYAQPWVAQCSRMMRCPMRLTS